MSLFKRRSDPSPSIRAETVVVYSGDQWLEVRGESNYQDAFKSIAGPKGEDGYNLPVTVALVREPANPWDTNAVAVKCGEWTVGFLSREAAEMFAPVIDTKNAAGETVCLEGHIRGGWKRRNGDEGHYGIALLYNPSDFFG